MKIPQQYLHSYLDKSKLAQPETDEDYARLNQIAELVQKAASKQQQAKAQQQKPPQVIIDSVSMPLLQACQTLDYDDLTKGFDEEELDGEGKIVLYITETQLVQLLKQRAVVVPNKKKLIVEDAENKKLSLIDEANRKSPYREVELVVKKEQQQQPQFELIEDDDSNCQQVPSYNTPSHNFSSSQTPIATHNPSLAYSGINNNYSTISQQQSPRQQQQQPSRYEYLADQGEQSASVEQPTAIQMMNISNKTNNNQMNAQRSRSHSRTRQSNTNENNAKFGQNYQQQPSSAQTNFLNSVGTSYSGLKPLGTNNAAAQLRDGKVINYKDFDLLVPTDRYRDQVASNGYDPSKAHFDYIQIGSNGQQKQQQQQQNDMNRSNSQASVPQSYGYLSPNKAPTMSNNYYQPEQQQQQQQYVQSQYLASRSASKINEDQALRELDKFLSKLFNSLDKDGNSINWYSVQKDYKGEGRESANLMNNYIKSLMSSQPHSPSALKLLDEFVDRVLASSEGDELRNKLKLSSSSNCNQGTCIEIKRLSDKDSLELIDDLIRRLRESISNWKTIKRPSENNEQSSMRSKQRTSTSTRNTNTTFNDLTNNNNETFNTTSSTNNLKRKVNYSYVDDFVPSTRVYEVLDSKNKEMLDSNTKHINDLFGAHNSLNYSLKPIDPVILDSIGKPSVKNINKYLSIHNMGLKNTDLVQIHPLLNNDTKISTQQSQSVPQHQSTYPTQTEPVIIDSHDYEKYVEDVSKHFGGLQIIDFPLYVQGLEFRQNENSNNNNDGTSANSFISSKPTNKKVATESASNVNLGGGVHKTGDRVVQPSETYTKQVVNNVNNIQYVRVNGGPQLVAAH